MEVDRLKVLIIEDDFASRKLIQLIFDGSIDYDVAEDGKEGLEAYKKSFEDGEVYKLVLLDIMLPGMNGQTVLKEIRDFEKDKNIWAEEAVKIIMMTALGDKENIKEAFKYQCEGYIVKPIRRQVLLTEMKRAGISTNI